MTARVTQQDLELVRRHLSGETLPLPELQHLGFFAAYLLAQLAHAEQTIDQLSSRLVQQMQADGRAAELLAPLAPEGAR